MIWLTRTQMVWSPDGEKPETDEILVNPDHIAWVREAGRPRKDGANAVLYMRDRRLYTIENPVQIANAIAAAKERDE